MDYGGTLTIQLNLTAHESETAGLKTICDRITQHAALFFPREQYEVTCATRSDRACVTVAREVFCGSIHVSLVEDRELVNGSWVPSCRATIAASRKHMRLSAALADRKAVNNEEYPAYVSRKARLFWDIYASIRQLFIGRRVDEAFADAEDDQSFQEADSRWQAFLSGLAAQLEPQEKDQVMAGTDVIN